MAWLQLLCSFVLAIHYLEGHDWDFLKAESRVDPNLFASRFEIKLIYDVDPATQFGYLGVVDILFTLGTPAKSIYLQGNNFNIAKDKISIESENIIEVKKMSMECYHYTEENDTTLLLVEDAQNSENNLVITFVNELQAHVQFSLKIPFYGTLGLGENWTETSSSMFVQSYDNDKKTKEYYISHVGRQCGLVFPCIEDPTFRATYVVSIGHRKDYAAISSMPVSRTSTDNALKDIWPWDVIEAAFGKNRTDFVWDHFEEAVSMHFYSVAFVICKFPANVLSPSRPKVTIWAREHFETNNIKAYLMMHVMEIMENNFKIPYSLPKLDVVIVPYLKAYTILDFIQNWGLIQISELHVKTSNSFIPVNYVLVRKIAHQWLGHLISIYDMREVPLILGCSIFIAKLAFHTHGYPPLDQNLDLVLEADALDNSIPVWSLLFDDTKLVTIDGFHYYMTPTKAEFLYRMLNWIVGEVVFMQSIHKYINLNQAKYNLIDTIWKLELMDEASVKILPSNVTLARIMETWTKQPGYPLLTVQRDYEKNTVFISQKRYLTADNLSVRLRPRVYNETWWIPISLREQNKEAVTFWMADNEGTNMPYQYENGAHRYNWIIVNCSMLVLCRVNYDTRNWKLLIQALNHDHTKIPVENRVQLLSDAFALAATGKLNYSIVLELAKYLKTETESRAILGALKGFTPIEGVLQHTKEYETFHSFAHDLINYTEITEDPVIVNWACQMKLPACEKNAIESFKTPNTIPVDLRGIAYCTAVARGGVSQWESALNQVRNDREGGAPGALAALTCTHEPWLLFKTIDLAINATFENVDDPRSIVFDSVLGNPTGFCMAKTIIYKWMTDTIIHSNNSEWLQPAMIILKYITTDVQLEEFKTWRNTLPTLDSETNMAIEEGIDRARLNIASLANIQKAVANMKSNVTIDDYIPRNFLKFRKHSNVASKTDWIMFGNVLVYFTRVLLLHILIITIF